MKLYGSLSELVSIIFRKNSQAVTFRPNQATTYTASRDIQTPAQDADSVLVSRTSTDTLTNKTLDNTNTVTVKDTLFTVQDDGDTTKQLKFQASGITTGTIRTLTAPDASTTIVGTDATQILTNKTLSGNTATTLISGSGTLTLNTTGTVTVPNATDTLVGKATTDILTNKTLNGNTATNLISGSGTLTLNTTGTITVPNATDTLVARNTSDTLTNKVLTAPIISTISNTGTITLPTATTTLVGRDTTDTLTNKSITSGQITGTTTNDTAASGILGEKVETANGATRTSAAATNTYKDLESFTLSAGDWDVDVNVQINRNGATYSGDGEVSISTTTASSAGTTLAKDRISISTVSTTNTEQAFHLTFRVSLTGSTTYHVNALSQFSAGTPQWTWYVLARRPR